MALTVTQIIYACVFISVLLLIEGLYLLYRSTNRADQAVNRRMDNAPALAGRTSKSSIIRPQSQNDPILDTFNRIVPGIRSAFEGPSSTLSPALVAALSVGLIALTYILLSSLLLAPILFALPIALAVGLLIPLLILNIIAGQQQKQFAEQLPDAINLITRGLQAGHPVPVALELVSREMPDPIASEFGVAMEQINFGRDRDAALHDISLRYPNPDFQFFLAAVEMQRESGGNLVDVLDNLTKIIRERANMKKKAWAVSAEGRLTAVIVGVLPYALLAFLLLTNPGFITGSIDNPLFWPLMGGAWGLWLVGMIWIWRMVNIEV